ncbi:uncharacterized protein SPAPADRAFT_59424 [Spathaspora passalidarum NRRL Y-27907]|uniref:Extracellular membrane protein CFEM domain-containing protein n=1 Tax=Spathaspora passalidarum (strain NRRL Y-27907 / 11-Y1) TaxID=619300 RepID=G3AJW1_SPAPN|nr:uncharacterized protein SPAPADRAFT_59424 [Spathaspora passalidarum NRRL Y-27907]EGW34012.1 hypothetical protein SPAPADRAFT_59424 [Spathaspora passalidarum NRRL Y-27907]
MKFLSVLAASVALASASNVSKYNALKNMMKREDACSGSCIEMQNTVDTCYPNDSDDDDPTVLACVCGLDDTFYDQLSDCAQNCQHISAEASREFGGQLDPASLRKFYCNQAAQASAGDIPTGANGDQDYPAATDEATFAGEDSGDDSGNGYFSAAATGIYTDANAGSDSNAGGRWATAYTSGGTVILTYIQNSIATDANVAEIAPTQSVSKSASKSDIKQTTAAAAAQSEQSTIASSSTEQPKSESSITTTSAASASKTEQSSSTTTAQSSSKEQTSSKTESTSAETKTTNGAETVGVSLISLMAIALL